MENFNVYKDMKARTSGEIYIGVVGPVRTGKSTFIKRFMDLLVIPFMEEDHEKERAKDELPQSSGGKTITTTEPKFIPKEAAKLTLNGDVEVKVRLIDCVGYMVEGASGHLENDVERMVKTPWFDYEIPFTKAAEIGTRKVISDHSTIGLVITTDGSFGDLPRENYIEAEEKTITELKTLHKPFLVLVNSEKPFSEEAKKVVKEVEDKYKVSALSINCEQLKKEDINQIMEQVLYEFPISMVEFYMPKWVEMLSANHPMKKDIIDNIRGLMKSITSIKDVVDQPINIESDYIKRCKVDKVDMSDGNIKVMLDVDETYYYEMLSDLVGDNIHSEYQLLTILKDMAKMKKEYTKVLNAMESVRNKGYGVILPERSEIVLDKPEVIRHGNKFGVKIKAESPSIHLIRANIETEIAPIVGTQDQAEDLIKYIQETDSKEVGMWETNIFGKTVEQLVNDGILGKINMIGEESQIKLQETMQKIVNDSNGGMVCIII
ncbi:MAG TPA: stage IV sporulation protein A [Lachnospiraceae bacterium]|nr:stage IV sporulation protein A [Lachnospiraceae bacterium]